MYNEVELARRARREYDKAWRKKNPEKVKATQMRYWVRRAERESEKKVQNERKEER